MKKVNAELQKITGNEKVCFISGIALVVQSLAFAVLSMVLWGKKRSLAKSFAAAAAAGGVTGALLLVFGKKKCDCRDEECGEGEDEDLFGDSLDEEDVFCNFENEDEDCCCGDCEEAEEAEAEGNENA